MINPLFRDGAGADTGLVSSPVSHRTEKNIAVYEGAKPSNRGGSRVVQVISRNHSTVSKPAFVTRQVLYCKSRNQLASHLVISSITQHTRSFSSEFDECPFARFRPLSILPRIMQKNS